MLSNADATAFALTLKLAAVSTLILLLLCTPVAWWLARTRFRFKFVIDAIIALPLVLPPTVLGFYLLIFLGRKGPLAQLFDTTLAFTFVGLVIGSVLYSLPFVIQPLQNAFLTIGERPIEVATTLRASPLDRFFSVVLPMAKHGYLTAAVLGFAHTLGEFGVVLMIGGSIPGKTQVASIAIYDHVESLEYGQAHSLSGALLLLSFVLLLAVYGFARRGHDNRR